MTTPSQIAANQQNAQLSTGPTSAAGKAISSMNAQKSGMYIEKLVMPFESQADFYALSRDYHRQFQPVGPAETTLVEMLVRCDWHTKRFDRIEVQVVVKLAAESGKSEEEVFVDAFAQTKNHPLHRLYQRRQQSQSLWFRALKELQALQKSRGKQPDSVQPASPEIGFVPEKPSTAPEPPVVTPAAIPGIAH